MDTNLGSFRNYLANQRIEQYDPSEAITRAIELGSRQGARIGQAIRQNSIDRENQKWQQISRQNQLDKITKEQEEGLYFNNKTNVEPLSNNRALFATSQVDKANKLAIALKDSEITYADYRKGMTMLQSQTGQYKAAEQVLLTGAEKYLAGLENDTLSNANDPYYEEFWSAVVNGEADIKWNTDENGEIIMEGNFPTRDGSEPVRVPMSDIDKLPSVLYKPTVSSEDFLESDVKNIYETRSMRAIEKMGEDGIYNMDKIERNEQGIAQGWAREKFSASFEEYADTLGEGDLSKKLTQYITDDRFGAEAFREARGTDLAKSFDPTKQTVSSFVNNMSEVDKTKLLDFFKEDWIQVSSGLYDKVEQDKFNAAEKARAKASRTDTGSGSGGGSDQPEEDFVVQQAKKILSSARDGEAINEKGEIVKGDFYGFENVEGMEVTPKYKEERDKSSTVGGTKQVEVPGQFVLSTPGGESIDISQNELNDPKKYMRKYFASMGISTKPTKTNPKTIDWYMNQLFSPRAQFNYE